MLPTVATQTLPGLVQRAASQLASATSAAEVLEARDMASVAYDAAKKAARLQRAKGAHDELIAKAHRAQADALEIEALAKRRLADEYGGAQERGEVAGHGGGKSNLGKPKVNEIGLSYDQLHEARQIRDAEKVDPGIVRRVLDERLEAGQEPTKAALRKATSRHSELSAIEAAPKQAKTLMRAWMRANRFARAQFLKEAGLKMARG